LKSSRLLSQIALIGLLFVVFALPARASVVFAAQVAANEFCHGTISTSQGVQPLPCNFDTIDPGPGGAQFDAMFYVLTTLLVGGDVVLLETDGSSDLIRFDPADGGFFFYSDTDGGFDTDADIGLPTGFNTNLVRIPEVDLGNGGIGAIYIPGPGQPGFIASAAGPVAYTFLSDTPEPATWMFALAGASLIAIRKLRISRK
jgi:hypothetical protein